MAVYNIVCKTYVCETDFCYDIISLICEMTHILLHENNYELKLKLH